MDFSQILKLIIQTFIKANGLAGMTNLAGMGFDKALELSQELIQQIRRILILFAVTFAALLLFLLGMHFFIIRLLDQLDKGEFALTNSIIFLLLFNAACILTIVYSTTRKTWSKAFAEKEEMTSKPASQPSQAKMDSAPIESAISLLILDFIKEREWKRQQQTGQTSNDEHQKSDQ